MPRQGLNRENVIDAAIKLIEEKGYSNFSINELAKSLNVRPASLYNHIVNIDEIFSETAARANSMMIEAEEKASKGKIRDEALFAIADAYRDFARSHYELGGIQPAKFQERFYAERRSRKDHSSDNGGAFGISPQ